MNVLYEALTRTAIYRTARPRRRTLARTIVRRIQGLVRRPTNKAASFQPTRRLESRCPPMRVVIEFRFQEAMLEVRQPYVMPLEKHTGLVRMLERPYARRVLHTGSLSPRRSCDR